MQTISICEIEHFNLICSDVNGENQNLQEEAGDEILPGDVVRSELPDFDHSEPPECRGADATFGHTPRT